MPRRNRNEVEDDELRAVLERLTDTSVTGPSLHEQFALVEHARERGPEIGSVLDRWFLFEIDELRHGLADAQSHQAELKRLHERLTSAPWFAAVFIRQVEGMPDKIIVAYQGSPRVVTLAQDVTLDRDRSKRSRHRPLQPRQPPPRPTQ